MKGISALIRDKGVLSLSCLPPVRIQEESHLQNQNEAVTIHWICWPLDFVLPSLQNCEKHMLLKSLSPLSFVIASLTDQKNRSDNTVTIQSID